MRNILSLVRFDLRRATNSVMVGIVMFGLIVIPSLFTWFNVIASWDPFDNTENLTVAVANTDEGFQSDLMPLPLTVGDQVVSALRANDQLNWEFVSEDEAIDGTESGEYYAAIVIPSSFSSDMMTFYTGGSDRTEIDYYVNEKKNALAPKVTDQGASEVTASINEVFAETLSEVGLGVVSSLSDYLEDADTQAVLTRLHAHVGEVSAQMRAASATADMFTSLISSTRPMVDSAAGLASSSADSLQEATGALGAGKDAAQSLKNVLGETSAALGDALSGTADGYQDVADRIDDVYAAADAQSASSAKTIGGLADRVQGQVDRHQELRDALVDDVRPLLPDAGLDAFDSAVSRLDAAIARQQALQDRLDESAANITDTNTDVQATHAELQELTARAKQAVDDAQDAYTGSLRPKLDSLADTLAGIGEDVDTIGGELRSATDSLVGSGSLSEALTSAEHLTMGMADSLAETAEKFDELGDALLKAMDTGDLSALTDLIGADPQALAAHLAEPVALDRVPVYSVVSFGAAMTPLYTVLALWVGALLISVSIRVDPPQGEGSPLPQLTPAQAYVGRFGIFAIVAFLQSSLVCLGSVFFTQVQPQHPFLLILAGWVASLVFALIVYTFVVTFGNAGKALAVLLLVIQISGSGGAYPLQVLPQWFQSISPFLPATHAVNAMRSAIAGIYDNDFWVSLGWLAAFALPALLLGLVLRLPFIRANQKMLAALKSTKLM